MKAPLGKDGDKIDVFIGPDEKSEKVYVINQHKIEGGFDEVKVMLCFPDREKAIAAYDKAFTGDLGPKLRQSVVTTTMDKFKEWLESGDPKKPFKSLAESLLEADPDEVNPREYVHSTYDWQKTLIDLGFTRNINDPLDPKKPHPNEWVKNIGNWRVVVVVQSDTEANYIIQCKSYDKTFWVAYSDLIPVETPRLPFALDNVIAQVSLEESDDPDAVNPKDYLLNTGPFGITKGEHGWHVTFEGEPREWLPDEKNATFYAREGNELHKTKPFKGGLDSIINWYWREKHGKPYYKGRSTDPRWARRFSLRRPQSLGEADPDDIDPTAYLKSTPHFTFVSTSFVGYQVWITDEMGKRGWPQDIGIINQHPDGGWFVVYARGLSNKLFAGKRFETQEGAAMEIWTKQHLRKGNLYTGMFEGSDPDAIDPKEFIDRVYNSPVAGYIIQKRDRFENSWEMFKREMYGQEDTLVSVGLILYDRQKESIPAWQDYHWNAQRSDMSGGQYFKSFDEAARWLAEKYELKESVDPDSVDPKDYLSSIDFGCRYMLEVDNGDAGYRTPVDVQILPPPGTPFGATIADDEWEAKFMDKLRKTEFPKDEIVWITSIQYWGPLGRVVESEDPDAVDAKSFLNKAFPTRGTIKDFAWALDASGVRAVGIRRQEDGWHIYGHYFGRFRSAKTAIKRVLEQFRLDNLPWKLETDAPTSEVTRMFHTIVPLHLLDGGGSEEQSFPPGYMIRN